MQEVDVVTDLPKAAMDANVIVVNGKRFVSGLYWKPLSSPRNFMKEARQIGKHNDWDIVAIRRSVRIQAGFISKQAGALKGMYSLAAALAGQFGQSWIGAFALGDGRYAVAAAHEGSIVPGYDLICSRDEALSHLASGVNLFEFDEDHIFAPADFRSYKHEANIYALLQPKKLKAEYQLKQLRFGLSTQEIISLALLILLVTGAVMGISEYRKHQKQRQREQQIRLEQLRQAQLKTLNENIRKRQSKMALAHPWAAMPSAMTFIAECKAAMDATPLSVGGWLLHMQRCDMTKLEIRYKRQPFTTLQGLQEHAVEIFQKEAALEEKGEIGMIAIPLTMKSGGDDPLQPSNALLAELVTRFQSLETPLEIQPVQISIPKAAPAPPGEPEIPAPAPDWMQYSLRYESHIAAPLTYLGVIENQNGIRIKEIKQTLLADEPAFKWSVSGELYAKK